MNRFMEAAISLARKAAEDSSEIPVGAVIVRDGEIIASAHNETESLCDPTAHAEILAIRRAAAALGDWRLSGCDLYVTLEPCPMCMAAIRHARIRRLYSGAYKPKDAPVPHMPETYYGIEEDACASVLRTFFHSRRED